MASSHAENPLTGDSKLHGLMTKIDGVICEKDFVKWKKSFLKVYTSYLDPDGVLNAQDANSRLLTKLTALVNRCSKVQSLIEDGNIHADQITAEGRRAVTNLSEDLKKAEQGIDTLLPKTSADEEAVGYDKFELGAILIQDGFCGYDLMIQSRDFVHQILYDDNLQGVSDSTNFEQIFKYYQKSIDVFVQVMEDTGLYQIMTQCVGVVYKGQMRKSPKGPELSGPGPDDVVAATVTTTATTTTPIKSTTKTMKKNKGKDKEKENITTGSSSALKDEDVKSTKRMNESRRKGGSTRNRGANTRHSDILEDSENLEEFTNDKTTDEKEEEKGEGGDPELLFYFDPKTNALGMVDRQQCGAKSKLIVDLDKEGKDQYQTLVEDEKERRELIWLLKKLERAKPKETSWLEEIKREKAAKNGQAYVKKDGRKMPSGNGCKQRSSTQSSNSKITPRQEVSSKSPTGPGFRDPFGGGNRGELSGKIQDGCCQARYWRMEEDLLEDCTA
jgi:hypothetical protein